MMNGKPDREKESRKKRRGKSSADSATTRRVSADELLSDVAIKPSPDNEGEAAGPVNLQGRRGPERRKLGLILAAVLIAVGLAALVVLEWDWVSEKASGIWGGEEPVDTPEAHLFLVNPTTGQEFQEESINTVIGLADGSGVLHGIVEICWNRDGAIDMYWVSEGLVGKAEDGKDIILSDALKGNIERPGELRYIMERITGRTAHYVVILPTEKALLLLEGLDFPPVVVSSDTYINNIFTLAWEKVVAGRTIKDMDRVVSYLVDEGGVDEYYERVRRSQPYLEEALSGIADLPRDDLEYVLGSVPGAFMLSPAGAGEEGEVEYMSSLLAAWAEGMELGCRAITVPEITILNGCGVVGAGSNMKNLLEGRGFIVAEAGGNAKVVVDGQEYNDFSHQTSVLYYGADEPLRKAFAEYVALLFAIPKVEFKESVDGLTVIVGNDLATRKQ